MLNLILQQIITSSNLTLGGIIKRTMYKVPQPQNRIIFDKISDREGDDDDQDPKRPNANFLENSHSLENNPRDLILEPKKKELLLKKLPLEKTEPTKLEKEHETIETHKEPITEVDKINEEGQQLMVMEEQVLEVSTLEEVALETQRHTENAREAVQIITAGGRNVIQMVQNTPFSFAGLSQLASVVMDMIPPSSGVVKIIAIALAGGGLLLYLRTTVSSVTHINNHYTPSVSTQQITTGAPTLSAPAPTTCVPAPTTSPPAPTQPPAPPLNLPNEFWAALLGSYGTIVIRAFIKIIRRR